MKVVILAGGRGTRLGEKNSEPKPLVNIGGKPIIWHIMKIYAHYGCKDFIVATGYKGELVRKQLPAFLETDWKVNFVNTGLDISKAGRLNKLADFIDDTFMLTWCDGVSDINISALLKHHRSNGKIATVTAIQRPARFGYMQLEGDQVCNFSEKAPYQEDWINGAFFVLEPEIFQHIDDAKSSWEKEVLPYLISKKQLNAYRHQGFWQCMDTPYDQHLLEYLWQEEKKWQLWDKQ